MEEDNILRINSSDTQLDNTPLLTESGEDLLIDVYIPPEPTLLELLQMAQGPAKLATEEDLAKDRVGVTKPNLHRRIDNDLGVVPNKEVYLLTTDDYYLITEDDYFIMVCIPDETASSYSYSYTVSVGGVNSFRTSSTITHDEDSNDSEVP